jgi:hypothetical protein
MSPGDLDVWVAKDAISPIGNSGLVELLAVIGAAMLSTTEAPKTPNDIKKACIIHGVNWRPDEAEETPATAAQIGALFAMAGVK